MRKKILIVVCLLLIAAMAVSALAAGTVSMTVTPAEKTLKQGESVVITVSVAEFADCKSGSLRLEFDSNSFTRSDEQWLLTGMSIDEPNGDAVFAFSSAMTVSGDIYRFTLTAKENATLGDSAIAIKLELRDAAGEKSEARQAIKITVSCAHTYGSWHRLNDDQHNKVCTKCGDVVKENHAWDEGSVTQKPTCTEPGVMTHTCTACGATITEPIEATGHAYDNDCDTECNNGCGTTRETEHKWDGGSVTTKPTCTEPGVMTYTCTVCGATTTEPVEATGHTYNTMWSYNSTEHWHQCNVCGDKTDVSAHTPGPAATEWDPQTCKDCGYVLQKALGHTHKYGSEWIFDEMGHWLECSGCDELKDYSDHHFDNACDTVCNDCGCAREIQHDYGQNWWFDADGHWQECIVCGEKSDVVTHEPGPEATEETAQTCTVCGYELAPALNHTHDFGAEWFWDGTGHWQICGCGVATVREDHVWGEPTVTREPTADKEGEMTCLCQTCGAEKREPIPVEEVPTQPTQPTQGGTDDPEPKEFPTWILIVAGAVLALGIIAFFIIGAIIGQKQTGKFSAK